MKKVLIILSALFVVHFAQAAPLIVATVNNGLWKNNSTWNLNRTPQDGDTVFIPAGIKVIISNNINLGNATIYLKINGTLELDGGKLDVGNNSTIVILNGAAIVAKKNSDQIKIGNTIKFKGTETIVTGPSMANSNTSSSPTGFLASGAGALPVKFLGFNVARQNNNVIVDWSTAQEISSKYFEVQRSENGNSWTTIATIDAAGNSSSIQKYSYLDRSVSAAIVYYRIKMVDINFRYDITAIRSVKMQGGALHVKISSAANNNLYIHFSEQVKSDVSVKILSVNGQVVTESKLSNPIGQQNIAVKNNLKGIYFVSVSDYNGFQTSAQVLF